MGKTKFGFTILARRKEDHQEVPDCHDADTYSRAAGADGLFCVADSFDNPSARSGMARRRDTSPYLCTDVLQWFQSHSFIIFVR